MGQIFKFLICLYLITITITSHAIFFARQIWVHPETGNQIELYFDIHMNRLRCETHRDSYFDPNKIVVKQQTDFIKRAEFLNAAVVIEDRVHFFYKTLPTGLSLLQRGISHFEAMETLAICQKLKKQNVHHINVECRKLGGSIGQHIIDEVNNYDDGPRLNELYNRLKQLPSNIINYQYIVDRRFIHTIHLLRHKKYLMVAGGGNHMHRVAFGLESRGYRMANVDLHPDFHEISRLDIESAQDIKKIKDIALRNKVELSRPFQMLSNKWAKAFTQSHPINIQG